MQIARHAGRACSFSQERSRAGRISACRSACQPGRSVQLAATRRDVGAVGAGVGGVGGVGGGQLGHGAHTGQPGGITWGTVGTEAGTWAGVATGGADGMPAQPASKASASNAHSQPTQRAWRLDSFFATVAISKMLRKARDGGGSIGPCIGPSSRRHAHREHRHTKPWVSFCSKPAWRWRCCCSSSGYRCHAGKTGTRTNRE